MCTLVYLINKTFNFLFNSTNKLTPCQVCGFKLKVVKRKNWGLGLAWVDTLINYVIFHVCFFFSFLFFSVEISQNGHVWT